MTDRSASGKERPAKPNQGIHSGFKIPEEHFIADIGPFPTDRAIGIDEAKHPGVRAEVLRALDQVDAVLSELRQHALEDLLRRAKRLRGKNAKKTEVPGVIFLEVDGLAHDVLQRAIRDGNAATVGRWYRDGHRLISWECDWSSQTSGCQAGLLHGNNHDIPAFRWWEKDRGAAMVSNHPVDAMALERRLSDGNGLLAIVPVAPRAPKRMAKD